MLTRRQFMILNVHADDEEMFYFSFAEVNFGGQVFSGGRDPGAEPGGVRYEGDRTWVAGVPAREIADDLLALVSSGLLVAFIRREGVRASLSLGECEAIRSFYDGYDCVTCGDHNLRYGYGPHCFEITEAGKRELQRPEYREFARAPGLM